MSRNWWKGLAAVAVAGVGLLLAIPSAPAEPPSELVKKAIKTWQTREDLKPIADYVDKQIGEPAKPDDPPKIGQGTENAKGYAIHIACETVDSGHYGEGVPDLPATVKDRDAMATLSKKLGYEPIAILRATTNDESVKSTRKNVLAALDAVAKKAKGANGDIVLITYSGHGGQVPDEADDADEEDGMDETWCLWDAELIDDEVRVATGKFETGVRVVFVLDSCHSGTATRAIRPTAKNFREFTTEYKKDVTAKPKEIMNKVDALKEKATTHTREVTLRGDKFTVRALPPAIALATYARNEAFYKDLATKFNKEAVVKDPQKMSACIITLSGCADPQTSLDIGTNGLYTQGLLKVWADGAFDKDYNEFQKQVKETVSNKARVTFDHKQEPQLSVDGQTTSFASQKLFRIK